MNKTIVQLISCLIPNKTLRVKFRNRFTTSKLMNYDIRHIYTCNDAHNLIAQELNSPKPSLICRFGGTEMRVIDYYLKHMDKNFVIFPQKIKNMIETLSGFFPANDYLLSRFSSEFINLTRDIDLLAVWGTKSEKTVCKNYLNPQAKLITLSFENLNTAKSWTQSLAGKKVLVIHPFAETIKKQYSRKELVFSKRPNFLPDFELITMKPVQGLADSKKDLPYKDWFEALDDMKQKISKIDFDIAIIGAGAFGIFLGHYCKQLGKKAVHVGGATQILFGIRGKRWDVECYDIIKDVVNEYWCYPDETEKPKGAEKVEGGCYW